MELKEMTKVELEVLSYTDLTFMILKENKQPMNTPSIFKKICTLLEYTDSDYENKIGDYYTSLTLDKRFILLDTAEWDLRANHSFEIKYDEDEDEDEEEVEEEEEEIDEKEDESTEEEENVDAINDEDDLDDNDDDALGGLTIATEEELEEM